MVAEGAFAPADELGVLPKGWRWASLKELINQDRGICYGIVQPGKHDPSGVPMVNSQDVVGGRVSPRIEFRVSTELHKRYRRSSIRGGEILLTLVGANFGQVAIAPPFLSGFNCSRAVGILPVAESPEFVALCLRSPLVRRYMDNWANTTAQPTFNLKDVASLPIPWPPMSERNAIAHILGTLDDKIELNRRMNETLETMARALFKSWFVDFDPVRAKAERRDPGLPKPLADLFPDSFEGSELGEIPKGWRLAEIGDIANVIDCLHAKKPDRCDVGRPFLQLNNIRDDGLIDMTDTYFINEADYQKWISRMEATKGDCVITNVGRVGAVAQIPDGVNAALGRNMTGIRCKQAYPYPTSLIECLLSDAMRQEITRKMDSGTILNALNVRNIPKLRFVQANDEIMARFEQAARPLRQKMDQNLRESSTLVALRDMLLPKLISGELRVMAGDRLLMAAS